MSVINKIITRPISVSDIQTLLGVSSTNVGTLCGSSNIKRWSKNKPVVYNTQNELTDAQRKDANYGFSSDIAYWTRLSSMATGFMTNNPSPANGGWPLQGDEWDYIKPGSGNWCRMGDFTNYWHGAETPVVGRLSTTNASYKTGDSTMLVQFEIAPTDSHILNLSDLGLWSGSAKIAEFANMYLGVCFYFSSSKFFFFTQSAKISELQSRGAAFFVPTPSSLIGTCTCFAFCSSLAYTSLVSSDSNTGMFVPIPMSKSELVVTQASYDFALVAITAYRTTSNEQVINYKFYITNNENSAYNVDGYITVSILDSSGASLKSLTPYSNTQIPASSTKEFSGSINTQSAAIALKASRFQVSCTIKGTTYVSSCNVTSGPSVEA